MPSTIDPAAHALTLLSRGSLLLAVAAGHAAVLTAIAGAGTQPAADVAARPFYVDLLPAAPPPVSPEPVESPEPRQTPAALQPAREVVPRAVTPREHRSSERRRAMAPPGPGPVAVAQPAPPREARPPVQETVPAHATTSVPEAFDAPSPPVPPPSIGALAATRQAPLVSPARFDAAYLSNPAPAYPLASRRLGEQGTVLLMVEVDSDGGVTHLTVEQSSGHERLDRTAMSTVARWRFVPARRGDDAIASAVQVPIVFRLEN